MTSQLNQVGNAAPPVVAGAAHRPFEASVEEVRADCELLGVGRPVPLRVRVALRRRLHLRGWQRKLLLFAFLLAVGTVFFTATQLGAIIYGPDWLPIKQASRTGELYGPTGQRWVEALTIAMVVGLCWAGVDAWLRHRHELTRLLLARRYALVVDCAKAIHACAVARRGGEDQPERMREVPRTLRTVRRGVLNAHDSRGTVPCFSHRRRHLKEHERYVAAALMGLEAQLDRRAAEALRDIADALLTVADRYCHARVGELLDEEQLTGIPRQRNWEPLRYLIAIGLGSAGVTVLDKAGVIPEDARAIVYPLVLLAAFVIAFGRNVRRVFDVIGVITGP
ncbi:hypothetical protein ACFYU4_12155 [Streptomyces tendae]|uniref:hypothetical protein n=1 Tax=Streptomyces tendae TaxID=1932 RepID=UPI003695C691